MKNETAFWTYYDVFTKGTFSTKKSPAGAIRFCPGKQRCQDGVATSKVEIEILYRSIPFILNVGNLGVKA